MDDDVAMTADDTDMESLQTMLAEQKQRDASLTEPRESFTTKPNGSFPWKWVLLAGGLVLAMVLGLWYASRKASGGSASSSTSKGSSPVVGSTTNNINIYEYFYGQGSAPNPGKSPVYDVGPGYTPTPYRPGLKPPQKKGTGATNPGGNPTVVPHTSTVSLQNAANSKYAAVGTTYTNGIPDTGGDVAYKETVTGSNAILVHKITTAGNVATYTQAAHTYQNLLDNPVGAPILPGYTRNQIIAAQRGADTLYYRYGVKTPSEFEALLLQSGAGSAASRLAKQLASQYKLQG